MYVVLLFQLCFSKYCLLAHSVIAPDTVGENQYLIPY